MYFFFFSLYLLQKPKTSLSPPLLYFFSPHILFLFSSLLFSFTRTRYVLSLLFSFLFSVLPCFLLINVSLFLFLFIICLIDFKKIIFKPLLMVLPMDWVCRYIPKNWKRITANDNVSLFNHWRFHSIGNIKKIIDGITYDVFINDISYSLMEILTN